MDQKCLFCGVRIKIGYLLDFSCGQLFLQNYLLDVRSELCIDLLLFLLFEN